MYTVNLGLRQPLPGCMMPVANEGLGWDSLLKMVHDPGGDCYWEGGQPNVNPKKMWEMIQFDEHIWVEAANSE